MTSPEPKVFLPKSPIEFSNQLIGKLDSSVESDYTRSQYSQKHIQDLVNEELKKQQQESSKLLKQSLEKLPDIAPEKFKDIADSNELKEKLASLKSKLSARPKPAQWPSDLAKARETLVACFTNNKEKPLKCQQEFEDFKAKVRAFELK